MTEGESLATVENVLLEHATDDKFGDIRSARLRLRRILKAIEILEPMPARLFPIPI